jgi:hypothetical protein
MVVITMEWEVGSSPMEGKTRYQDAWQYTQWTVACRLESHNTVSAKTCEAP